ncbi:MAG: septum formation initiator family protein [Alphaproteobacteria bacterium]
MSVLLEIRRRARSIVTPLLSIMVVGYFGYHAVQGDRGLIAWWQVTQQIKQAEATEARLKGERSVLEHRVSLLSAQHLDPDLLDERARVMLNLARPDEVVILHPYDETPAGSIGAAPPAPQGR